MVPNRDIACTLENLAMDATADHRHVDQMMETILQLTETNKILREQQKTFPKQTHFWLGNIKKIKKATRNNDSYLAKLDPTKYLWNHGWRVTKGHSSRSCKTKKDGYQYGTTRLNTLGESDNNKDWRPV